MFKVSRKERERIRKAMEEGLDHVNSAEGFGRSLIDNRMGYVMTCGDGGHAAAMAKGISMHLGYDVSAEDIEREGVFCDEFNEGDWRNRKMARTEGYLVAPRDMFACHWRHYHVMPFGERDVLDVAYGAERAERFFKSTNGLQHASDYGLSVRHAVFRTDEPEADGR